MPRVCLIPHPSGDNVIGGVHRVISQLAKYLPRYDWQVTKDPFEADIIHGHAVCGSDKLDVYTNHGIYPVSENMPHWMRAANRIISRNFKLAEEVTTVCKWTVSQWDWWEGIIPTIIYNFIDLTEWDGVPPGQCNIEGLQRPFALWAKVKLYKGIGETLELARRNPDIGFAITVVPKELDKPDNVVVAGILPFDQMKLALRDCSVYLSLSTADNFPFQVLEAMALGKPVLAFAAGGIPEAIRHKQEGYLITDINMDEIQRGFEYCLGHAEELGRNARKRVEEWFSVEKIIPQYIEVYERILAKRKKRKELSKCSIVITTHNFKDYVKECIDSALAQDYKSFEVIVVDDCSTDGTWDIIKSYGQKLKRKRFNKPGGKIHGIVRSRNEGVKLAKGEFVACLDGDDRIKSDFLSKLIPLLEDDNSLGIAYSDFGLFGTSEGVIRVAEFDFERLKRGNFIPCCNLFRKKAWERVGGCKPVGESWEDYNTWLTFAERGWGAKRYPEPLYWYRKKGEAGRDWESQPYVQRLRAVVNAYHPLSYLPTVSVIIPCYDQERYLKEAIDSIFAQAFQDFEIIVVNDGSPGEPKAITDEYWDPRLRLIEQENQGLSAARNAGIAAARGKYILPLDADDKLDPTFLEKAVEIQKERGGKVAVYSNFIAFWDSGEESEQELADYNFRILLERDLMPCTILYPKAAWKKIGGYKPVMKHGYEDWEFAISLGEQGCYGIRIREFLFYYRQHAGTSMRDTMQADGKAKAKDAKALIKEIHEITYMSYESQYPLNLQKEVKEEEVLPDNSPIKLKYIGKKEHTISYWGKVSRRQYEASLHKPFIWAEPADVPGLLKLYFVEA